MDSLLSFEFRAETGRVESQRLNSRRDKKLFHPIHVADVNSGFGLARLLYRLLHAGANN